jgi:hypothetical protein
MPAFQNGLPVQHHDREDRAELDEHVEHRPLRGVVAEQLGGEDQVAGRGDGHELGQALDDAEQDGGEGQSHGPRVMAERAAKSSAPAAEVSPDVHALLGRQVELVAGLHVERLVPRVLVAHDFVDAAPRAAVRVGPQPLPRARLALGCAPDLRPGEEEAAGRRSARRSPAAPCRSSGMR